MRLFNEQLLTQDLSANPNALANDYNEHPTDQAVLNSKFILQIIKNIINQSYHLDSYVNDWDIIHSLPKKHRGIVVNDINKDDFLFYEAQYEFF